MNSNYLVSKLYAQGRINSHLEAAEAHRLAQQSKGRSQVRGIATRARDSLTITSFGTQSPFLPQAFRIN